MSPFTLVGFLWLIIALRSHARAYTAYDTKQYPTNVAFEQPSARFAGGASVDHKVYFAPNDEKAVGVFDTRTDTFSQIPVNKTSTNNGGLYAGTVAYGNFIYMAPAGENNIGKVDTRTDEFSSIDIPLDGEYKYDGALIVGSKMYMTPCYANNVGILDLTSGSFVYHEMEFYNDVVDGAMKRGWGNGAVVGENIYFSPWGACVIAVFNMESSTWSKIPLPGVSCPPESFVPKYWGASAHDGIVYFFPSGTYSIMRLDPSTESISAIDISFKNAFDSSLKMPPFYYAYTAQVGTTVFLAPGLAEEVGAFDMKMERFSTIAFDKSSDQEISYWGAAVVDDSVYFGPFASDYVLRVSSSPEDKSVKRLLNDRRKGTTRGALKGKSTAGNSEVLASRKRSGRKQQRLRSHHIWQEESDTSAMLQFPGAAPNASGDAGQAGEEL